MTGCKYNLNLAEILIGERAGGENVLPTTSISEHSTEGPCNRIAFAEIENFNFKPYTACNADLPVAAEHGKTDPDRLTSNRLHIYSLSPSLPYYVFTYIQRRISH